MEDKNLWIALILSCVVVFFAGQLITKQIERELSKYTLPGYSEAFDDTVKSWKIVHRGFIVNSKYAFSGRLAPSGRTRGNIYLGVGDLFWKNSNSDTLYISRSLDTFYYVLDIEELK